MPAGPSEQTGPAGRTGADASSGPWATASATAHSSHSGYSGSGFCNTHNVIGAAVQFTVDATDAGTATLAVRYANGSAGNRPADILVNGAVAHADSATGTVTARHGHGHGDRGGSGGRGIS